MAYMRGLKFLHPAMLVGWIINNSGSSVADGNNPGKYSGIEGQISDLKDNCYYLKIKVFKIW